MADEAEAQAAAQAAAEAAEAEAKAAEEASAAAAAAAAAGDGGGGTKEMVEIDGKQYEKGTPEYVVALEKVNTDYHALLPEYTKKTQALSEIEKAAAEKAKADGTPKFLQPDWTPKTWNDIRDALREAAEYGKSQALGTLSQKEQAVAEAQKQIDSFVAGIVKESTDFNEQDFFQYIERHKLRAETIADLQSAYSVYKETNSKGGGEPGKKGGSVAAPAGGGEKLPYDPADLRIRGGSIIDMAKAAFRSFSPKT